MLEGLVVWYLFLGGAGAGLLLAVAVLEFLSPQAFAEVGCGRTRRFVPNAAYCRFFGPAYGIGIAAVVLGMVCLLLDLGRSERALSLFFQPSFSFITVGAFALVVLVALAALLFAVWGLGISLFPKTLVLVVRICCAVAAFAVMLYAGLFLSSMPAVPLWVSPWLPVLFVASALSSGLALLVCVVILTGSGDEFASTLRRIQRADVVVIACELVVLALFLVMGLSEGDTARLSTERLVQGDLAGVFWGGVVVVGLVAPVVCDILNRRLYAGVAVISSAMVLAGGFFLRWCLSEAGSLVDIAASVMRTLGIQ